MKKIFFCLLMGICSLPLAMRGQTLTTPKNLSVSSITACSATITWEAGGSETKWEVVVSTSSTTPAGSGTSVTSDTYQAVGLIANTSYYVFVRATDDQGNTSDWTNTITATFTTLDAISIGNLNTVTICSGGSVTLTYEDFTGASSNTTYSWTVENNANVDDETSGSGDNFITGNLTNNTTSPQTVIYAVTPYSSGNCPGNSFQISVAVNPAVVVNSNISSPLKVCNGENTQQITLDTPSTYSYTGGMMSYTWTNDNTDIGLAASGTGDIASFTATNNTTVPVAATIGATATYTLDAATTCTGNTSFTIIVNPTAFIEDQYDTILCNEGSITLTENDFTGDNRIPENTTYTWTVNQVDSVDGETSSSDNYNYFTTGNLKNNAKTAKKLTYKVIPSTDGCEGDTFKVYITINPEPKITMTCPDTFKTTLAYGTCSIYIDSSRLGTPTWTHSLGWEPISITLNRPTGDIYPEGETTVTWTMKDTCGNSDSCRQIVRVVFPDCGESLTANDYEGNEYSTVRVGCECWMAENLKSTKYSDGSTITSVYNYTSDLYPNTTENVATFGRLYSWYSTVKLDENDNTHLPDSTQDVLTGYYYVQGVCPAGWAVPTNDELQSMVTSAGGVDNVKSSDANTWLNGYAGTDPGSGFDAVGAGYYNYNTSRYENLLGQTYYWTSTPCTSTYDAVSGKIIYTCPDLMQVETNKNMGYSVRCIKKNVSAVSNN